MAVRALLHYALEVPDQSVGETFYRSFGLVDAPSRDGAVHLHPARLTRDTVLLYAGPRKRLHHLAFGAPGDEMDAVRRALAREGVRETDPPRGAPEGGVWVRDPDGHAVNIRPEDRELPPADTPLTLNSPGHIARVGLRGCPEGLAASPRRLGHVLLFTPDIDRQIDFYTRVLGLKLSDRSRSIVAFLRCTTDHHNLAFLTSKGPGFHHASFEVGSIDEIAIGAQRMLDAGAEPGWGSAATSSARTSSTTRAIHGAASRSTSTTWTTSPSTARGSRGTSRRRTPSTAGARRCPTTSAGTRRWSRERGGGGAARGGVEARGGAEARGRLDARG